MESDAKVCPGGRGRWGAIGHQHRRLSVRQGLLYGAAYFFQRNGLADILAGPELLGGLPVPRLPAEIEPGHDGASVLSGQGRILDLHGGDVTEAFLLGAKLAVDQAHKHGCTFALLTEGSPSCGTDMIYSGHHDGVRRAGMGVVTAALTQAGVQVFSSEQIEELASLIDS